MINFNLYFISYFNFNYILLQFIRIIIFTTMMSNAYLGQ